mgnify:CR=1 FL=1
MKKLIAKITAEVSTMLEPAATLKLVPRKRPNTEVTAPKVDERRIIDFAWPLQTLRSRESLRGSGRS